MILHSEAVFSIDMIDFLTRNDVSLADGLWLQHSVISLATWP